jgi:translation initiation factor IF-3
MKGRQKSMPERGQAVMLKMIDLLSEYGEPESTPKLEGDRWLVMMKPRRK